MNSSSVSVILPVYNGVPYLPAAIESVLAQTHTEFEFLICDDGSTDHSLTIIQSYSDKRIQVLQNTNNISLFPTLNRLVSQAQHEFIRLWSQDDIMKPRCLEQEIAFHRQHPEIGMSYCLRDGINEKGEITVYAPNDDATPEIVLPWLANQISFYHGSMPGNIATVMLKKSILAEVGAFREDMLVANDFEMWVRIMERYPIGCIHQSLILLRTHSGQFSQRKGVNINFMRENREIFETLRQRLPADIRSFAERYQHRHHLQYVNYMVRCLLTGDWRLAYKSFKEINQFDNIYALFCLWLISGNGRWFKLQPKYTKVMQ